MDYYDVTTIDGVNLPMEMKPDDRSGPVDRPEDSCECSARVNTEFRSLFVRGGLGKMCRIHILDIGIACVCYHNTNSAIIDDIV